MTTSNSATTFNDFLTDFFKIFASKTFRGGNYLSYLKRSNEQRSGDEAPIVDTAIVGPILGLLGFAPAERVYNQQRQNGRPDFAPADALYGTCFIVEDKSTSLQLTLDLNDPHSNLSQLAGYLRSARVKLGWLTNGRQFMIWEYNGPDDLECIIDLDLPTAITEWQDSEPPTLSSLPKQSLYNLFDLCHKSAYTEPQRLEKKIATDFEEWQFNALPLGTDKNYETTLVETLQSLTKELQRDAHRILVKHLERYEEYVDKVDRLTDDLPEPAARQFKDLRGKIKSRLESTSQLVWGLEDTDIASIEDVLINLEHDAKLFASPKELQTKILAIINAARERKYPAKSRQARPLTSLDEDPTLDNLLQTYIDKGFAWHQRKATLRYEYQNDLKVYDDYTSWKSIVQETMLGGLDEAKRREEFALQAAYVVFIRLLLIRVCEDKGVFPHRFLSDGGLKEWQKYIARYYIFASGNPYLPLLNIAYENAQNIYTHFFTGRDLFNWYQLDKDRFIMTLYQLSRFNFAEIDSDIIGTIYNTYVSRKEKGEKGQYYTPSEIIDYILDNVGYSGKNIIGSNKRLIDPACGSGSFLVAASKRLIAAYKGASDQIEDPQAVIERVKNSLFGFDLNPFVCYLAEVNLLIQILDLIKLAHERGQHPKLERFHIYNVDALARPSGVYYYMNFNTLLAEENDQVNKIKSRAANTPYAQGFAFVVANPPYGAKLSEHYKESLRANWADIFYGQPDTYTFFLKLGIDLLARNGRLGFITPNTYLMGKNTANLRNKLLTSGCIEEIVDLPQGIWADANVDCTLLFLTRETSEEKRRAQQVQINLLDLKDTLDKLTNRAWLETLTQQQTSWMDNPRYEITIRYGPLLQQIDDICRVSINGGPLTKVLRLGDVTESSQGIIPYKTKEDGQANTYIRSYQDVPFNETDWKPMLDGHSFIGRYDLRWGETKPYLKYGKWLWCAREEKYFESPKLLVQDMRNRSLKRRLIAAFDNQKFYNRHNFSNIIARDPDYDLKYILALFNSSLLNYWFARQFDNLHINPSYFRQLPIYPADKTMQSVLVELVDAILGKHAKLNELRALGYVIRQKRNGSIHIEIPYNQLLQELTEQDPDYPILTFFDARTIGLFDIPAQCDLQATISSNVYIPDKYPTSLVLRHNKLWLEVPEDDVRRYLHDYLKQPQWQGKTWNEIRNTALIPEDGDALRDFFAAEARKIISISSLLDEIARIDAEIDEFVLDLYHITDVADRQRILGSAPIVEEEAPEEDETEASSS